MQLGFPDECIRTIAENKLDLSICALMSEGPLRNNCYSAIIPEKIQTGTVSDCRSIVDQYNLCRYGCMIAFAERDKDMEICGEIPSNYSGRSQCYEVTLRDENNPKSCSEFEDEDRIWKICNEAVAKNTDCLESCQEIQHDPSRILCTALIENNWNICEQINTGEWSPDE
ncbi:MAG: hypothetical protein GWP12_00805 [Nitrospirae bacterium]|nr:hypothetical protein [Nitrospirota bacterium]